MIFKKRRVTNHAFFSCLKMYDTIQYKRRTYQWQKAEKDWNIKKNL